jgi:hypothetical protein
MAIALVGAELLKRVHELGGISKADLVRGCGYAGVTKDGGERLNYAAFYEELLSAAKVVDLSTTSSARGRTLSNIATVQGNGNLLIGKAYVRNAGFAPGDQFAIKFDDEQAVLTFIHEESTAANEPVDELDTEEDEDEAEELPLADALREGVLVPA